MGCEFVDIFSLLLSRNMRNVLTSILALLGDLDLIRYDRNPPRVELQPVFDKRNVGTS